MCLGPQSPANCPIGFVLLYHSTIFFCQGQMTSDTNNMLDDSDISERACRL